MPLSKEPQVCPDWANSPHLYDPVDGLECFVDWDGDINVIVIDSHLWLSADAAEKFGKTLIECAQWRRAQEKNKT